MSDDLRNKEDIAATARRMSAKKLYRTPVFIRLGTLYDLTMSHGNARKDGGTIIRPTFTGRGGRNGGSHQWYYVALPLLSYGPVFHDLVRRAAASVDKILRGSKADDLPIQNPDKFEMIVNLKTAKALGLTVPPFFLAGADKVIEWISNVRSWPKADMKRAIRDVRYWPEASMGSEIRGVSNWSEMRPLPRRRPTE